MGIEIQSLRLLLLGRELGIDFDRSLTVGRLDFYPDAEQVAESFHRFGLSIDAAEAARIAAGDRGYAEPVLRALGADRVDSIDISDFEGATILHDLNQPPPPSLAASFSLVMDGGTLEHVFDFPTALRTCMTLPRVGGHLVLTLPANNEMGHGFYQFSPELFFRALSPANGYRIEALFLSSLFDDGEFLAVRDPAKVGRRLGWNGTGRATQCFVIARRVADVPLFASAPQQSDYAAEWSELPDKAESSARESLLADAAPSLPLRRRLQSRVRQALPARGLRVAQAIRNALANPPSDAFLSIRPSPGAVAAVRRFYAD